MSSLIRGMWVFLIGLLLTGCGEAKRLELNFTAVSAPSPDLVLIFRFDEDGSLRANFDTSAETVDFQPETLAGLLAGCENDISASAGNKTNCVDLANHVGEDLFRGVPRLFDTQNLSANVNVDISSSDNVDRFYVLFIFGIADEAATVDERCLRLVVARKVATGFSVEGVGSGTRVAVEIERGDITGAPAARECFSLGID